MGGRLTVFKQWTHLATPQVLRRNRPRIERRPSSEGIVYDRGYIIYDLSESRDSGLRRRSGAQTRICDGHEGCPVRRPATGVGMEQEPGGRHRADAGGPLQPAPAGPHHRRPGQAQRNRDPAAAARSGTRGVRRILRTCPGLHEGSPQARDGGVAERTSVGEDRASILPHRRTLWPPRPRRAPC